MVLIWCEWGVGCDTVFLRLRSLLRRGLKCDLDILAAEAAVIIRMAVQRPDDESGAGNNFHVV